MPKLEMFEIEENEVYTEVEITEEQAEEYGVIVVGMLDGTVSLEESEECRPTLH